MEQSTPPFAEWLKPNYYIDLKDKQGIWRVALVLSMSKSYVKVRYDGWSSKFDETFPIGSPSIRPFRSVIRGYTGSDTQAGLREHFTFTQQQHTSRDVKVTQFINTMASRTEIQINQFIRGDHYAWLDFLMTCTFNNAAQISAVIQYFFKHLELLILYFQTMIQWLQGTTEDFPSEGIRAFADAYSQIFDSVYCMMDCATRTKGFWKNNKELITSVVEGYASYLVFMSNYVSQIGLFELLEKFIDAWIQKKQAKLDLTFAAAFTRVFFALEKILPSKQKKKQLVEKYSILMLRQSVKMPDILVKQYEYEVDKIYQLLKILIQKYPLKVQILSKFQILNMNMWKSMIMSEKLQRKIKGITKLKSYYLNLISPHKKQVCLIFNSKDAIDEQLRRQNIISAIFCDNEHHEIIKKGGELLEDLYREGAAQFEQLSMVWKSCRHRLEAVRKAMYSTFINIVPWLKKQDMDRCVDLVMAEPLGQQSDKLFFYSFMRKIIDTKSPQLQPLYGLLNRCLTHIMAHPEQMNQFTDLLTCKRSYSLGLTSKYINQLIDLLFKTKDNSQMLVLLQLVNQIYEASHNRHFDLSENSFYDVFGCLKAALESKETQGPVYELKRRKIAHLLKLLENMEEEFEYLVKEFMEKWDLFALEHNKQFRQAIFEPWILCSEQKGMLKLQTLSLNKCLLNKQLKQGIFNEILKKHTKLDYINMSELQFKIFSKFLIEVNIDASRIEQYTTPITLIQYYRIKQSADIAIDGLKQLWDIFLNCRVEAVIKKAIGLIKCLYLNVKGIGDAKIRKLTDLTTRINRHLADGLKKSNIRLIRNTLQLIYELIMETKQTQKLPKQYQFINGSIKGHKRVIKIAYKAQLKSYTVSSGDPIRNLKSIISKQYEVPLHSIKLHKVTYDQRRYEDDEGESSSSSVNSFSYTKNSPKAEATRVERVEQIPKQMLFAPIFSLMLAGDESKIVATEFQNIDYIYISRFVCQKISQSLLKILIDTDQLSKQTSELSYLILSQIPSSLQPIEILTHLTKQLRLKSKTPSLALLSESLNLRMYFYKNINKLSQTQLDLFFTGENMSICEQFFQEIGAQIVDGLQIELMIEAMGFFKRSLVREKMTQIALGCVDAQKIIRCLLRIAEFLLGPKSTDEYRRQENNKHNLNQYKLTAECFSGLELLYAKDTNKILTEIIHSEYFAELMVKIFKQMPKTNMSEIVSNHFQRYFSHLTQNIDPETEQIIFHVIFDVIYFDVVSLRRKKNRGFFRIVNLLIMKLKEDILQRLFHKPRANNQGITFWETCLNVLRNQADYPTAEEKQNPLFSAHLKIVENLVLKIPSIVTDSLWRTVLEDCLCYKNQDSTGDDIKCLSKTSIEAGLNLLLSICFSSQKYLFMTLHQLRKYQQTDFWRNSQFWNVDIELESKSPSGYVGLENPGCICYLNSFTQVLFTTEQFKNHVINFAAVEQGKDYALLAAMRDLFLQLQYSNQKYLSPVAFTKTIKNQQDKPMIKIYQQMDIEEYSSILFDKIEKLLPKEQDFVKEIFGGKYSNDIISQECKHCSQREEDFLSVQLDVKSNIEESLRTLVKGETLQGENAYFCQQCNKKVKAIKRLSIKKLPNNLIICLKRFEYNFQIDQKIKVNSYCEFPKQISFEPFSQQFLNKSTAAETLEGETPQLDPEYFQYKLKGVIIHTGSSDSGHYYALIETDAENGKWLQFNDSTVQEFDLQKLPEEAFGSDNPTDPKFRNAYMLIYERKKKLHSTPKMEEKMEQQHYNHDKTSDQIKPAEPQAMTDEALKIYRRIKKNNKEMRTYQLMFSEQYGNFLSRIMQNMISNNKQFHKQLLALNNIVKPQQSQWPTLSNQTQPYKNYEDSTIQQMLKFYLQYNLLVKSRDKNSLNFLQHLKVLAMYLRTDYGMHTIDYLLHELQQPELVHELFFQICFYPKLLNLSHFIADILCHRLKCSPTTQLLVLFLNFFETVLSRMLQTGSCINQVLYILRKLAENYPAFHHAYHQMQLGHFLMVILAGLEQGESPRRQNIARLRASVARLIYELESSSCIEQQQNKQNMMREQKQYEIRVQAKKTKVLLQHESPSEAWIMMRDLWAWEAMVLGHKGEGQRVEYFGRELTGEERSRYAAAIQERRQQLVSLVVELKSTRVGFLIDKSQEFRQAAALSFFFCELCRSSQKVLQKCLGSIRSGLKTYEATKFRPYLIFIYYLCTDPSLPAFTIPSLISILLFAMIQNKKWFSEVDILQQWLMKLIIVEPHFAEYCLDTAQGNELLQLAGVLVETMRKPAADIMKKQKLANYQRYAYLVDGVMVSPEADDYESLYLEKKHFYYCLSSGKPIRTHILKFIEPSFDDLKCEPHPGAIMKYMFYKKWVRVVVRENRFGRVIISRLLKTRKKEENLEEKKGKNFVEVDGKMVQLLSGEIVDDQCASVYVNDDKLRNIELSQHFTQILSRIASQKKIVLVPEQTPEQLSHSLNYFQQAIESMQNEQQESNVSYESSSKHEPM